MKACLITTGQPATNPRLVKEADALTAAGFDVHVVAAHWADWATEMDLEIVRSRSWKLSMIDWRQESNPSLFMRSRVRYWALRNLRQALPFDGAAPIAALSRVGPELLTAAKNVHASIYIAHNLGALPIACSVAKTYGAKVGFDAEDFHSGQLSAREDKDLARFTRSVERRYIRRCTYVTAASPGIAQAYRELCHIPLPTCILNVFPLRERPIRFRTRTADDPLRLHWFSQTIGPTRGLEDAVRAIGLLGRHDVELHLRGRWQAGYEDYLRELATESGVTQRQIVSYPPAQPEQLVRLSSEFDVGLALEWPVSTNNNILLSNKIFTYLLAGNAVIASRTSSQRAIAPQLGQAIALSEPENPASVADVLKTWLEHPSALDTARDTAWRLGESRYNWDYEQTTFLGVVAEALGITALPAAGHVKHTRTAVA